MVCNTLYTNDNLFILNGLNSEIADLIYLDPPFNTKQMWAAPIGSKAAGASFKDMWTWQDVNEAYLERLIDKHPSLVNFIRSIGDLHSKDMMAYVVYMTQRIIDLYRILKGTGSLYLHCDGTASHYLKLVLDEVFGKNNFRNEIIWQRNDGRAKGSQHKAKKFGANTDTIFFYTKSDTYFFTPYNAFSPGDELVKFNKIDTKTGRRYHTGIPIFCSKSMGDRPNLCFEWRGFTNPYPSGWRLSKDKLEDEYQKGNVVITDDGKIERRKYLDDYEGEVLDNNWVDISRVLGSESTGYRTQKPLDLLKRIILASSKIGDLVLDPFCGCATTCVAAQQLGRKWIGIDIEKQAVDLLIQRLGALEPERLENALKFNEFISTDIVPQRTDVKIESPSLSIKERLFKEQAGLCNGCGVAFEMRNFDIDHIVPKSKGGGDYYENYQLLCGNCNTVKGNRPMEYLRIKIAMRQKLLDERIIFGE